MYVRMHYIEQCTKVLNPVMSRTRYHVNKSLDSEFRSARALNRADVFKVKDDLGESVRTV